MTIRSFTGYRNVDLFGGENPDTGDQFTLANEPPLLILLEDGNADLLAQGDGAAQEQSSDPQGDQIAFVRDASGTVLVDGAEFYLESTFTFTIAGQTYTGYHFEQEGGAGLDFTIFPPNLPAGQATVTSVNFFPNPDSVPYATLGSGNEVVDEGIFSNLNLADNDTIIGGAGNDLIDGGAGDDVIEGNGGNDTIYGGSGSDTISGGGGADIIRGDSGTGGTSYGDIPDPDNGGQIDDEDDLSGGFSIDAGTNDINFSFVDDDLTNADARFEYNNSDAQYTEGLNGGQVVGDNAIYLGGPGAPANSSADTSTTTITFTSNDPAYSDAVTNVNFRINDIDQASWRDIVTIRAFDADGNPVAVTLTGGSGMTLSDTDGVAGFDTAIANAGAGNQNPNTASASLLVEIEGPVATIEIDYGNLGTGNQRIDLTEIFFETVPLTDGPGFDDTIDGGGGNDIIFGELGNDTISGGSGNDTIDGGVGDDIIDGGSGTDSIVAGEGDDEIRISSGTDTIQGGAGADTFTAQGGSSLTSETITVTVSNSGDGTIAKTNDGTTDTVTSVETFIADEAIEENDRITLTAEGLLVGDVSGIDDSAVGLFFPKDGSPPIAFGGPGQPTFSDMLAGNNGIDRGPAGDYQITGGDESGQIGNIAFENFENIDFSIICFADGTLIETAAGPRPVETLKVGDTVLTADNGPQPIRWTGRRHLDAATLAAQPNLRPIRIKAGALAADMPSRDLIVSPQHRILVRSRIAIRMFDAEEVFVPAKHLLGLEGVDVADDLASVTYVHFMCDEHEIVTAEGALAETLYTGTEALKAMTDDARAEIDAIFGDVPYLNRPLARPTPKGKHAKRLIERHVKNDKALYSA